MSARSHYELLGVPKDATTAQIKAAYRKLARTTHPDTGGDGALFALITEAYNTLVDPASRDAYDRQLSGSYAGAGRSTGSARTTTASGGGGGFAGSRRAQEVWEAHASPRGDG